MPQFIQTTSGRYVNADDIMFVQYEPEFGRRKRIRPLATLTLRDGATFYADYGFDLDEFDGSTTVPAAPGAFAWTFFVQFTEGAEPELHTNKTQVVAWRVSPDKIAEPVYLEPLAENERAMFEEPDGRLNEPYSAIYHDLESAKADVLQEAIAEHAQKFAARTSEDACIDRWD